MAKIIYKKVRRLNPEIVAYIAGIIDGEGTIALSRKKKTTHRLLEITISSTEYKLLKWVLDTIGVGTIIKKRSYKRNHAISWVYYIRSQQAFNLLQQVLPYLQTYKRKRAKLVLANYNKLTPRNGKYSKKILTQRKKFIKSFFAIKLRTGINTGIIHRF